MKLNEIDGFFVDIDGTITDYKSDAITQDALLAGNFLFPILRDMLQEKGWDYTEASKAIAALIEDIVFWDYTDLIDKFNLSRTEAFRRIRQWHDKNLTCYDDMIETVKALAAMGKKLFIISNNPYWGCRFKLEKAGLATPETIPCFKQIFGTNLINGCKNSSAVWHRALAQISVNPGKIATIGDNPAEDGKIPQSCGIGYSFILNRKSQISLRRDDNFIYLNDARHILTESI